MKNKFKPILKLKKQALELAEARVAKAQNALALAEQDKDRALKALNELSLPSKGASTLLRQALASACAGRAELERARERASLASKELAHFKHLYKQASLEFEKVKYLYEEEAKASLKAIARQEALSLDEFGVLGFARTRR